MKVIIRYLLKLFRTICGGLTIEIMLMMNMKKKKVINANKIFKLDECVICSNKPPNILFCNCGYIPICRECDETEPLNKCPVCKIDATIKRHIFLN